MAVENELSPEEKRIIGEHKPEVDRVAYETYLRRIACGCLTCTQFLDRISDTRVGEMHVLIMHGTGKNGMG